MMGKRKQTRSLYFIFAANSDKGTELIAANQIGGETCEKRIADLAGQMLEAVGKIERPGQDIGTIADYDMFDWEPQRLPGVILGSEVPHPGIIIAIRFEKGIDEEKKNLNAHVLRMQLQRQEKITEFISSVDARFQPHPMCHYDVFISYSHKDTKVASQIEKKFRYNKLDCFMASKDISAGTLWKEEIRDALRSSRVVLILLTPNSINSKWVMCEAGAFWALAKPLVPAYMFIDLGDVPEIISAHQCRCVETDADQKALAKEVFALCRN